MLAWGCSCGRLSSPGDRFCASCGSPQTKGEPLASEAEKAAFLKRAELNDGRALRGVRRKMREVEKSYKAAADELFAHATADYARFDGWFGEWLRGGGEGADPYGGVDDPWDDYDEFD